MIAASLEMKKHAKFVNHGENRRSQVYMFLERRDTCDAADPAKLDNQVL